MPKFIAFARDAHDWDRMSPQEIQDVMERYIAWADRVRKAGTSLSGAQLGDDGRVLGRGSGGQTITDGPYVESKEILGGYSVVEAADLDEAARIFSDHPHLAFGTIEVRQTDELIDELEE